MRHAPFYVIDMAAPIARIWSRIVSGNNEAKAFVSPREILMKGSRCAVLCFTEEPKRSHGKLLIPYINLDNGVAMLPALVCLFSMPRHVFVQYQKKLLPYHLITTIFQMRPAESCPLFEQRLPCQNISKVYEPDLQQWRTGPNTWATYSRQRIQSQRPLQ